MIFVYYTEITKIFIMRFPYSTLKYRGLMLPKSWNIDESRKLAKITKILTMEIWNYTVIFLETSIYKLSSQYIYSITMHVTYTNKYLCIHTKYMYSYIANSYYYVTSLFVHTSCLLNCKLLIYAHVCHLRMECRWIILLIS